MPCKRRLAAGCGERRREARDKTAVLTPVRVRREQLVFERRELGDPVAQLDEAVDNAEQRGRELRPQLVQLAMGALELAEVHLHRRELRFARRFDPDPADDLAFAFEPAVVRVAQIVDERALVGLRVVDQAHSSSRPCWRSRWNTTSIAARFSQTKSTRLPRAT